MIDAHVVAPTLLVLPEAQELHAGVDDAAAYFPKAHDVHALAADNEYLPARQAAQAADEPEPVVATYLPAAHPTQADVPTPAANLPTAQSEHPLAPAAAY